MFAALGARVHLIDGRDTLLPFLDPDLSQALAAAMERPGIVFWWKENGRRRATRRGRRDRADS